MSKNKKVTQRTIDKKKIKEELEKNQILDIQKELIMERKKRLSVMTLLLSALIFTVIFGTIQNPFQYTFSQIGNRFTFEHRLLFIIWATYTGFVIQVSILALFALEKYSNKLSISSILIATFFLFATSLAPSLDHLPFWRFVHLITAGFFALFVSLGFYPFILWVARENPRLRLTVYVWLVITWGGALSLYFILGNTGTFEIWFFTFFIIFLLYLSLNLFEEQIVKQSIVLLRNEDNLNYGIEKIFIDLDEQRKRNRNKKQKKAK